MIRSKVTLSFIPVLIAAFFIAAISFYFYYPRQKMTEKKNTDCQNHTTDMGCFSDLIDNIVKTKGVDAALEKLASVSRSDENFSGSCHAFAHQIGQQAYKMFIQKKDIKITPKIAYCTYGFYHGFMEAAAQINGDYKTISDFCAYVNNKLRETGLDASAECYHGIGHGAVEDHTIKDKQNPEALAQNALALCKKAIQTDEQMINCASGVFNGIANFYIGAQYGFAINKQNPGALCKDQLSLIKKTCYAFMARVYLAVSGGNFRDALNFAQKTAESEFMDSIVSNASVIYVGRYLNGDVTPIVSSCRSLPYEWHAPCVKGMVIGLIQLSAPEKEIENGDRFCGFPMLSPEEKAICIREMFIALKIIYPREKFMNMCKTRNASEQVLCLSLIK